MVTPAAFRILALMSYRWILFVLLMGGAQVLAQTSIEEAQKRLAERQAQRAAAATQPAGTPTAAGSTTLPTTQAAKKPKVIFVFDASGSMIASYVFIRMEASKAIRDLDQPFNLMIDNGITLRNAPKTLRFRPQTVEATQPNKAAAITYLNEHFIARGAGQIEETVEAACKEQPDLIWLLSDGGFGDKPAEAEQKIIKSATDRKIRINTVVMLAQHDQPAPLASLRHIAEATGGRAIDEGPKDNLNKLAEDLGAAPKTGVPKVPEGASVLRDRDPPKP